MGADEAEAHSFCLMLLGTGDMGNLGLRQKSNVKRLALPRAGQAG